MGCSSDYPTIPYVLFGSNDSLCRAKVMVKFQLLPKHAQIIHGLLLNLQAIAQLLRAAIPFFIPY